MSATKSSTSKFLSDMTPTKSAESLGSDEDHTSSLPVIPTIKPSKSSHSQKVLEKANVSPWVHFVAGGYVLLFFFLLQYLAYRITNF